MRNTFIETLCALAEEDERIWLLCGDLGYSVLERFATRFPRRYMNMGVAEQNMTGVATGLALSGKIVFTYSIANFPVMRCLEQIRNDVGYHNANVKIVAVGGGLAYGTAGYTHHGIEDIAVMRVMPNMTVVAPADPVETRLATRAVLEHAGPCYLRLGKGGEPVIHSEPPDFQIGRAITLRTGDDVTLISTGAILSETLGAANLLREAGIQVGVISMPTVRPLDTAAVLEAAGRSRLLVTTEEHSATGGLGGAVAEALASAGAPKARLIQMGIAMSSSAVGAQTHLRRLNGLDASSIAQTLQEALVTADV